MKYKVAIQKVESGEIRFYDPEANWNESERYLWLEGNYSCDCNRENFFKNFKNITPGQCGYSRFRILYAELLDGTIIPLEE
jgi:hypothetical protein